MAKSEELVLPVAREQLQVRTRRVDAGRGVRIHKTVSAQLHHIEHSLLRDALEVRRIPVDRVVPLSEAPSTRQEGDTLIVPVLEEVLVVEKRLRIKEEIHIVRNPQRQAHAASAVLRAEQVTVEHFDERDTTETTGGTDHATDTDRRL